MKLREAAELKWYAACLEWEGLQELELAMAGTPASWLWTSCLSGSTKLASWLLLPLGLLPLVQREDGLSLLWGRPTGTTVGTSHPLLHPSTSTSCQILQVSQLEWLWQNVHVWAVWKAYLQPGLNGIPLPSGTSQGPFSLSPIWDELFRSPENPLLLQ